MSNVKQAVLFLMMLFSCRASPLQDPRFEENYLDDDLFAKKHPHHENTGLKPGHVTTPKRPISHHHHSINKPNYLIDGLDHHDSHIPSHIVDDVHHRPIYHHHDDRPMPNLWADTFNRPEYIPPVHSHLSSVFAPMVRNVVSNILINIAHGVSNGIVTGLVSGRPSAYDRYPAPHRYRPYIDYHKSSDSNSYENLDPESNLHFNDFGFIDEHSKPEPERQNVKESSEMKPSTSTMTGGFARMSKEK